MKRKFQIIGLAGKMKSGKDTLADLIMNDLSYKKINYGDYLKELLVIVTGLSRDDFYTQEGKGKEITFNFGLYEVDTLVFELEKNDFVKISDTLRSEIYHTLKDITFKSPRQILQFVATEIIRQKIDPDLFVKVVVQKINNIKNDNRYHGVIVADVRFKNERRALQRLGGKVYLIRRYTSGLGFIGDLNYSHDQLLFSRFSFCWILIVMIMGISGVLGYFVNLLVSIILHTIQVTTHQSEQMEHPSCFDGVVFNDQDLVYLAKIARKIRNRRRFELFMH